MRLYFKYKCDMLITLSQKDVTAYKISTKGRYALRLMLD
jgi:hypothetical protein